MTGSARDRAIAIVAGESKSTDRGGAALHAWAAVEALIANPAVLRALTGEAGAPDTPTADVPAAWWSPTAGVITAKRDAYRDVHGYDLDELPSDAVRLVPAAAPTPTDDAWSAVETVARELEILARPDTVHGKWILGKLATNLRAVLARRTEETR